MAKWKAFGADQFRMIFPQHCLHQLVMTSKKRRATEIRYYKIVPPTSTFHIRHKAYGVQAHEAKRDTGMNQDGTIYSDLDQ